MLADSTRKMAESILGHPTTCEVNQIPTGGARLLDTLLRAYSVSEAEFTILILQNMQVYSQGPVKLHLLRGDGERLFEVMSCNPGHLTTKKDIVKCQLSTSKGHKQPLISLPEGLWRNQVSQC